MLCSDVGCEWEGLWYDPGLALRGWKLNPATREDPAANLLQRLECQVLASQNNEKKRRIQRKQVLFFKFNLAIFKNLRIFKSLIAPAFFKGWLALLLEGCRANQLLVWLKIMIKTHPKPRISSRNSSSLDVNVSSLTWRLSLWEDQHGAVARCRTLSHAVAPCSSPHHDRGLVTQRPDAAEGQAEEKYN